MSAIEFQDVSKCYGHSTALDGLSFRIDEGERVVLHGPSGCGKTTVLRLVAGFLAPDTGKVLVGGQVVAFGQCPVEADRVPLDVPPQSRCGIGPYRAGECSAFTPGTQFADVNECDIGMTVVVRSGGGQGMVQLFEEDRIVVVRLPDSEYLATVSLPEDFKGSLPSIEELDAELKKAEPVGATEH